MGPNEFASITIVRKKYKTDVNHLDRRRLKTIHIMRSSRVESGQTPQYDVRYLAE